MLGRGLESTRDEAVPRSGCDVASLRISSHIESGGAGEVSDSAGAGGVAVVESGAVAGVSGMGVSRGSDDVFMMISFCCLGLILQS